MEDMKKPEWTDGFLRAFGDMVTTMEHGQPRHRLKKFSEFREKYKDLIAEAASEEKKSEP